MVADRFPSWKIVIDQQMFISAGRRVRLHHDDLDEDFDARFETKTRLVIPKLGLLRKTQTLSYLDSELFFSKI